MDVDGTLTDGRIYMGPDGEVFKSFDVRDGYAIANMLPEMGIVPVIITARSSAIVERRCEELGITHLYQGVSDKLAKLREVCADMGVGLSEVCYVGDDLNDLECMRAVAIEGGIAACPSNSIEEVRKACNVITGHSGGNGAVREVAERIISLF